jgi:Lon protease-like protein
MVLMTTLPLFPLNTVLFPGIPFHLHIFEERYKEMISQCLEERATFGVVLIKKGIEALGPAAEPHSIGCTAEIVQVENLPDGRYNILVVGQERFRIQSLYFDQPYLVGEIEIAPFKVENTSALQQAGSGLRPLVNRYLEILAKASESDFEIPDLPEQPLELAYLAAHILQTPMSQKQSLLDEDQGLDFLLGLGDLYPAEIAILETIVERSDQGEKGVFSLN